MTICSSKDLKESRIEIKRLENLLSKAIKELMNKQKKINKLEKHNENR